MKSQTNGAQFLSYFETHHTEMLEFVRWLVEQESMSREAEATRRIAENFGDRLAEIGAAVDLLHDSHYGATLRARFAPHAANQSPENQQLLVVGHLDTVWPLGTLDARPFRVKDGRAYGPGIFDMKAGVTIATTK